MLELFVFDELDSTQKFLVNYLKRKEKLDSPLCVLADRQSQGIGSRNNVWEGVENGLTFSFALDLKMLPQDLPLQSFSLYFGFLFKEYLNTLGNEVWMKWPNDLYLGDLKVGGVITQCLKSVIVCGTGLNLNSLTFASLKLDWSKEEKQKNICNFLDFLMTFPKWKEIFNKYKLEFYKNSNFIFHHCGDEISLQNVELCEDGSILSRGQRFYSLR